MVTALSPEIRYSGSTNCAQWQGLAVSQPVRFRSYMANRVKARISDESARNQFSSELSGLATTGMETEFVKVLLDSIPEKNSWSIGEAFAECVLADDDSREIIWPWNSVRDRRTPRASLPGADLVGFCRESGSAVLIFGEVKTSSDKATPPNVMYGKQGMAWQLESAATCLDVQHALLTWLRFRCVSAPHLSLYRAAVQRFVASQGKDILLVGVLLRDTEPNELDVVSRVKSLASRHGRPTRIEITAWYLPIPIVDWPALLHENSS